MIGGDKGTTSRLSCSIILVLPATTIYSQFVLSGAYAYGPTPAVSRCYNVGLKSLTYLFLHCAPFLFLLAFLLLLRVLAHGTVSWPLANRL